MTMTRNWHTQKAAFWKHLTAPGRKAKYVSLALPATKSLHSKLKMLELGYPFDTVQMPLNPFDADFHSFEKQLLPEVNWRGMAAPG